LTSITSRPFTGQLGSAEQASDIELASGKGILLNESGQEVGLFCMPSNALKIASHANNAYRTVVPLGAALQGGDVSVTTGRTVDTVHVAVFNALNIV